MAKKGILCKNEAEMRAYDVLLNLDDSSILRQILTYRREMRESMQVKFALSLFSCFKNGNYIRFFKLLKRNASYLQCCLCHRYFYDIRNRALYVMTFSSHKNAKYPIAKLVDILGFDSVSDATEFIVNYNMPVDTASESDDIYLLFSKSKFCLSATRVPKMSLWIEEKRSNTPIAQILSGGSSSEVILKQPANSFNEQGIYTSDPVISDYIENFEVENDKSRHGNVVCDSTIPDLQNKIKKSDENMANMIDSLANGIAAIVIDKEIGNIFAESMNCNATVLQTSAHLYDGVLDNCIQTQIGEVSLSASLSSNQSKKENIAQEICFENNISQNLLNVAEEKIVGDRCATVVNRNKLRNDRKLLTNLVDSISGSFYEKLMENVADELVKEIGNSVLKQEIENVQKQIAARLDK
ncbi:unnamed protein product [Dracunculus medinensis]|uniref:PCI domain-containing protein n=1 Tax=Dracunculus medinensis TaxID=318479 RepID=A0A3P7PEJ7_DRAME|nr:unnamed protein product [Dracunculus medinensis]